MASRAVLFDALKLGEAKVESLPQRLNRQFRPALKGVDAGFAVIGEYVLRIEPDRLVVIRQRLVIVLLIVPLEGAEVKGVSLIRIEPKRLSEVGNRLGGGVLGLQTRPRR